WLDQSVLAARQRSSVITMGGTIWSTQHDMVRMSCFAPDPRGHYRQKSRVEFRRGPILVSASASITIRPLSDIREDTIVVHLRDRHTFLSDKGGTWTGSGRVQPPVVPTPGGFGSSVAI